MVDKSHKRRSFSLAEVLVTLTVIGVLAAMTIPPLVQNYQKQEYVTKLKKVYTTTNQVLQQIATDSGCVGDIRCSGLFVSGMRSQDLGNELVKYFNVAKNCTVGNTGCWAASTNYYIDGKSSNNHTYDTTSGYKFVTADGVSILIENYASNGGAYLDCGYNYSVSGTGPMSQTCGFMRLDVNGTKPPNLDGRDTFYFFITNGNGPKLYPAGGQDNNYWFWWNISSPSKCSAQNPVGTSCTGRIMEENWEMNY